MSEDNVVRPVFGRKSPLTQAAPTADTPKDEVPDDYKHIGPLEGEALERARIDLVYMIANGDFVHAMRNKLEEAGNVIFALKGFTPDTRSIELRRKGLKSYTLEEICRETEKTHQMQWRSQPSYLGALTLEHHERVQLALSFMNEPESKDAKSSE